MNESTQQMLAALGGSCRSSSLDVRDTAELSRDEDVPNLQPDMQALMQNCLGPDMLSGNTPME